VPLVHAPGETAVGGGGESGREAKRGDGRGGVEGWGGADGRSGGAPSLSGQAKAGSVRQAPPMRASGVVSPVPERLQAD